MTDWTWYFTPDLGQNGAALQLMETPTGEVEIRKVTQVVVGPQGQIGYTKWVPIHAKMCGPVGKARPYTIFPCDEKAAEMLDKVWSLEGTIIPANGRILRQ